MDEKRDQLISYMQHLASNPNVAKIGSVTNIIYRLVVIFIALIVMIVGYIKMVHGYGDNEQNILIFKVIFWFAFIADFVFFMSEILKAVSFKNMSRMMNDNFNQIEYEELVKKEKVMRKSTLICDAITEFMKSIVAFIICMFFVVGGIYMGVTNQGGSLLGNVMCIIIFPLMGITAIIFMAAPFIGIVRELMRVDRFDWEEYNEIQTAEKKTKEKKIKVKDYKLVLFGSVFFFCGLLAFLEGFTFFPQGEIGQGIGMNVLGLVFMTVGGCISYFLGVKGVGE